MHISIYNIVYIFITPNIIQQQLYQIEPSIIATLYPNLPLQKMTHINDSRVQFFNSQSSFGSSSIISTSRIQFIRQQIINDIQQIFSTLKFSLLPRQDLLNRQQLQHIIHRARIMSKQTIPQWYKYLTDKQKNQLESIYQVNKLSKQLEDLIKNYESYRKQQISYQQFYQIYANHTYHNFNKVKSTRFQPHGHGNTGGGYIQMNIQPDIINIIQSKVSKGPRPISKQMMIQSGRAQQSSRDRQIYQLNQQIIKLKKQLQLQSTKHENIQKIHIKQTNQRIKSILKLYHSEKWPTSIQPLKQQIYINQKQLSKYEQKQKQNLQLIEIMQNQIQELKNKNRILNDQLQSNRRMMSNSRVSEMGSQHDKSVMSQFDGVQAQGGQRQNRKLYKNIKNLQYQNNLLKTQLQKQRDLMQKQSKTKNLQLQNQNKSLKKTIQQKIKQLTQCKIQMDSLKIQNIKLKDQIQRSLKHAQLAVLQASNTAMLKNTNNNQTSSQYSMNHSRTEFRDWKQNKDRDRDMGRYLDQSSVGKCSIHSYKGDGNQYTPYYELLNKQFKIRFKRSCLKQKQLLYKANGLQIGVISQFLPQTNQIKIYLHFSNFCNQNIIKNIKIKISNARGNRLNIDTTQIKQLKIGQQVKNIVSAYVKSYPIGCTALICEYQYVGKYQQVRVLLPVHIFKMLTFKPRDGQFTSPKKITLIGQKKIIKDYNTLLSYFKGCSTNNNNRLIQSTILHQQTQTKIICDIDYDSKTNNILITYQHRNGDQNICEYVIKTIVFLFKKEESI